MPRLKAAAALTQHGSKRRDREALAARLAMLASFCRDLTALTAGATGAIANSDVDRRAAGSRPLVRSRRASRARSPRSIAPSRRSTATPVPRSWPTGWRSGSERLRLLPRIALTVGDPSGIGPEIAVKAAADPRVLAVCRPVDLRAAHGRRARGVSGGARGRGVGPRGVRGDRVRDGGCARRQRRGDRHGADQQGRVCGGGLPWPGHTDLLAHLCGAHDAVMMFWSDAATRRARHRPHSARRCADAP